MTITYDKQILIKRGNTAEAGSYVGPLGELVLDTDTNLVYVHDGVTAGGHAVSGNVTVDGTNYSNTNVAAYLTSSGYATQSYVDAKITANISAIIDSAPGALDTLNELAAALGDDASFSTTLTNSLANVNANVSALQSQVDGLTSYANANVASYLTSYNGNIAVDYITFQDQSEQYTAWPGAEWRSSLTSDLTVKPSWMYYYPGGDKLINGTSFGFDAQGMWFAGNANYPAYPIRTNVGFHQDDKVEVVATIHFEHQGDDQSIAVFNSNVDPQFTYSTNSTRIAFNSNFGIPVLYGRTTANTAPGSPVFAAGNWYTIKFVYDPQATPSVTVSSYAGNAAVGSPIDVRSINDRLPAGIYTVGFDGDQDQIGQKAHFSHLTIRTLNDTVTDDLEVTGYINGNLIPSANVTYSLGNETHQWKELWVSNTTIYMNSVPLSLGADNTLLVNNTPVVTYVNGSLSVGGNAVSGGTPTIPSTIKGFINLVGDKPNEQDDIWFESVVVRGQYAYALGSDYYINNSDNRAKVYKFDLETGNQVWVKQIAAGRGATFDISIGEGTIVINGITQMGQDYKAGEEIPFDGYQIGGQAPLNSFIIIADTVDEFGGILTASVKPGYNVGAITYNSTINSAYGDAQGDTVAISYDDFNGKLIVVQEYGSGRGDVNDSFWQWFNVYIIDPVTGVVNQTVTLTDEGDIFPNSIATLEVDGGIAIVGEKYNEYREFGPLTILAGGNGYFDILKSNLDPEHYPGAPFNDYSDFWITGTGIANQENVDNVNYYTQLPSTVQQGSGAQFQVVSAGDGIPYVSALATVPNKGSNYLVGHKIKILGTALGGATPANDAIITVTEIGEGGSIEAVTVSGTGGDVGGGTYNSLTGTNHNTGSGATFYTQYNGSTGITSFLLDATGVNYVVGDILTIAGTNFANGTSPANDVEIEVTNVDGAGGVIAMQVNVDDIPTDALRIRVDNVDFTVEGTWSMRQNLGGEAFIWTPAWTNAIGGPSGDRFYDVCWAADGQSLYAVGRGRYEVNYDQALVVKFDASDGSVVWGKDIKFTEASTNSREARAVAVIPGSTDIMVAGAWYNNNIGYTELILTRMTDAGAAVWQKTYAFAEDFYENTYYIDYEISLKATNNGMIVSVDQGTNDSNGLGWLQIDPTNGTVIRHRVLSSDGNSNYNYYNTPTANWTDVYTDGDGDHIVMAGYTYVPTDSYYNALLVKLPVTGVKDLEFSEKLSLGEHILTRHNIYVTTVTPAFDSFTPDEHVNTITGLADQRNYKTRAPDGELRVWTYTVTDDSAGFLEFGDGSKQSFATNVIPQIPAANDYYLTEQDSGKHIFFEHENGWVYIPHWQSKQLPVGFTFTVVNTTGSDCYVRTASGPSNRGRLKLAGRNINTYVIGIPDSGSGSMVTFLKVKEGYTMDNSDGLGDYPDVWMVSGPGDIYDND